tara:strand:- start:1200 stop:1787 length:588 start_codon:yes stop_codon:yes gene_type:complete
VSLFDDIKETAEGRELSLRWYRDRVRALGDLKAEAVIRAGKEDATAQVRPTYGMLNLFYYKPIHAKRLPYYDIFPLVLPVKKHRNGFTGLNFHYLSIPMRVKLLEMISGAFGDDTTEKLNVTYSKVESYHYVRPTVHRYRAKAVGSLFLKIPLVDMLVGVLLPVQAFYKGRWNSRVHISPDKVYRDSRERVNYVA